MPDPPRVVVIAGPNGSGKSTLTEQLCVGEPLGFQLPDLYVNADLMARALRESSDPDPELTAFHQARALRRGHRVRRDSFAYETVLSHPSGLVDLVHLRDAGYEVTLVYVVTGNPDLNIARVARRVRSGGHDVPPERVRARYERCLRFLPRAVETAQEAWIYDSTDRIRLCLHAREGAIVRRSRPPLYLRRALVDALRKRSRARGSLRDLAGAGATWITPDEDAGQYDGRVIGTSLPHAWLQEVGSGQVVCHDGSLLTAPVPGGEVVRLTYRAGYGEPAPTPTR
jgi:predicted ABC-type ATPase